MEKPRIEVPRTSSAPRGAYFVAGSVEVAGMDEFVGTATDHFLRRVSKYGFGAWAHLHQNASGVRDQDEILGGFKDTTPFLDLLAQGPLGSLAFSDVAGGLRCPDDLT